MTFRSRNFHLKEQPCLRSVPAARSLTGRKQRGLERLQPTFLPSLAKAKTRDIAAGKAAQL